MSLTISILVQKYGFSQTLLLTIQNFFMANSRIPLQNPLLYFIFADKTGRLYAHKDTSPYGLQL